jgi:osmotically-inducible protein OsmY
MTPAQLFPHRRKPQMPQDQRYGRQSSRRDWEDDRNREYGSGRDDWRGESRSHRSRRYEDEGGSSYGHDTRQDRDYQGTLRAGDYGRYEEEEGRSYPERYQRGGRGRSEYGESDFGREYGRGGYSGGDYGDRSYRTREYGGYGGYGAGGSRNTGSSRESYGRSAGSYGYGRSGSGSGNYGQGGGYEGSGFGSYTRDYDRNYGGGWASGGQENRGYGNRGERNYGNRDRDWWDRATDEVSSWFGDENAQRRRQMDEHRGRGPKNYSRSDDRIREDVSDRLTDDPLVDASEIEVTVTSQEVTLGGTVPTRSQRRLAEDCAESVSGVKHVQNNLRVKGRDWSHSGQSGTSGTSGGFGGSSTTTM